VTLAPTSVSSTAVWAPFFVVTIRTRRGPDHGVLAGRQVQHVEPQGAAVDEMIGGWRKVGGQRRLGQRKQAGGGRALDVRRRGEDEPARLEPDGDGLHAGTVTVL
jgi:hypothetical protein